MNPSSTKPRHTKAKSTTKAKTPTNLNQLRLQVDHEQWRPRYEFGDSLVLFDGIEAELLRLIEQATTVVGCVAWLTSTPLLAALTTKQLSLIVQKDGMFYPNRKNKKNLAIANSLKEKYLALPTTFSDAHGNLIDPIRIYGDLPKKTQNGSIRMHHKFLVFDSETVVTGSFNLTATASNSLENVIIIKNKQVALAFEAEHRVLLAGSKPLHWFH